MSNRVKVIIVYDWNLLGVSKEVEGEFITQAQESASEISRVILKSGLYTDSNIKAFVYNASQLKNLPQNIKISIFLPADKREKLYNSGEKLYNIKRKSIEILERHGIKVDVQTIQVKIIDPDWIEDLVKHMENRKEQYYKKVNMEVESNNKQGDSTRTSEEFDYEEKSKQYTPVIPLYSFDRVILPEEVTRKIEEAISILECEQKVFNEWGLYEIQPHPSTSLSFYGPPGTGKTMAAEAIADRLGKKILKVSYTDVESKYHGEGPKMIKAIFVAAKNADAVLFFDEADSLLSKRLTNVSEGSAQAINSMRSQLLISLEEFRGIVIFATNLIVNYDKAFLTRLISVEFPLPDVQTRKKIWDVHVKAPNDGKVHRLNIPLADDVDTETLANQYDFVGREIRNAVINACVRAAMNKRDIITQVDFIAACEGIISERESLENATDHTRSKRETNDLLKAAIQSKLDNEKA